MFKNRPLKALGLAFFIFIWLYYPPVLALNVNIPVVTNYSLVNVNNSQFLQGLTPTQVANLYVETDPVWLSEKGDYLTTATAGTTYVPYSGANNDVTLGSHSLYTTNNLTSGRVNTEQIISTLYPTEKIVFGVNGFNIYNNYGGSTNNIIQTYSNSAIGINHLGLGNSFYDTDVQIYGNFKTALSYDFGSDLFYIYSNSRRSNYVKSYYGSGGDSSIYSTGTKWIFDAKEVGTNQLNIRANNVLIRNAGVTTYNNSESQLRIDSDVDLNGVATDTTTNRYSFYNNMNIKNTADSSQQIGNFMLTTFQSNYDLTSTADAIRTWNNVLNFVNTASGDVASGTITTSRLNANTAYTGTANNINFFRALNNGASTIKLYNSNGLLIDSFNNINFTGINIGNITGNGSYSWKSGTGNGLWGNNGESNNYTFNGNVNISGDLNQVNGNATINNIYGGMWYTNYTATSLNFAVAGTFYQLFFQNATHLNGFGVEGLGHIGSVSNLTAQYSGVYQANYMAIGDGQNNHEYHTSIFINGVNQMNCDSQHKMASGGDILTQVGTCLIRLAVGDKISLRTADIGSTGTGNYYGANLDLIRVGN